ncbi:MAG: histidine kinase [Gemmatimonadetes bacterium]|nr:histidine kinase [Gemmatimonadota bacterium]
MISSIEVRHITIAHGGTFTWWPVLRVGLPRWVYLAGTLPLVLALSGRFPVLPLRGASLGAHAALFLAISAGEAVVTTWSLEVANPIIANVFPWEQRWLRSLYNALPLMLAMYGAVALAAWGRAEARERERRTVRSAQLEAQLHSARLASLRAQLQPHFLYNTLNGIAALVADVQPRQAVAAIEQLADLLKASLRDDALQQVTLRDEVELMERYLALQQMRFGPRLQFSMRIDHLVSEVALPVLLLQPIVENTVTHGVERTSEMVLVTITAEGTSAGVELVVENTGPRVRAPGTSGHGVGLAATRARLETAYGEGAQLTFTPRAEGGATVRVLLPIDVSGMHPRDAALLAAS